MVITATSREGGLSRVAAAVATRLANRGVGGDQDRVPRCCWHTSCTIYPAFTPKTTAHGLGTRYIAYQRSHGVITATSREGGLSRVAAAVATRLANRGVVASQDRVPRCSSLTSCTIYLACTHVTIADQLG